MNLAFFAKPSQHYRPLDVEGHGGRAEATADPSPTPAVGEGTPPSEPPSAQASGATNG